MTRSLWLQQTGCDLCKGAPASHMGEAHGHSLVLAQPELHVVAVQGAGRLLPTDGPLALHAQVRITLPVCTHRLDK